jgi:hypothetical protein
MTNTVKVVGTATLELINLHSSTRHYNRTLSIKGLDMLDPDGKHIITWTMIHEHAAGVKVDPHVRAAMLLKVKDSMTPVRTFLDMTFKDFNDLTTTVPLSEDVEQVDA